jgi:hypothetical protein
MIVLKYGQRLRTLVPCVRSDSLNSTIKSKMEKKCVKILIEETKMMMNLNHSVVCVLEVIT